jgi:hypothetical protein
MCDFVDHTVMENMSDYKEMFRKKGGNLEITGLDLLDTASKHPFGLRKMFPVKKSTRIFWCAYKSTGISKINC